VRGRAESYQVGGQKFLVATMEDIVVKQIVRKQLPPTTAEKAKL
jgi:hypothetical protein